MRTFLQASPVAAGLSRPPRLPMTRTQAAAGAAGRARPGPEGSHAMRNFPLPVGYP